MSTLKEVPTEELLSFQDYAITNSTTSEQHNIDMRSLPSEFTNDSSTNKPMDDSDDNVDQSTKSFWTLEYYQKFFDVDTKDVTDRIMASLLPKQDSLLKNAVRERPDLYGPFWISVTLVFTIAISGNIASYLQHGHNMEQFQWKYDFHLVSYAATTIFLYIIIVPMAVWGVIKWSTEIADLDGLETITVPKAFELICIYGYSLFVYIPVSILWTIQISWLQWTLVLLAASLSGSVLLKTLMPVLKLSRQKIFLMLGIIACHFLLAAGFMLYFFHVPNSNISHENIDVQSVTSQINLNSTKNT